jgi:1,4-dihydroxy-2-naphthoyl-CoA hydrolase
MIIEKSIEKKVNFLLENQAQNMGTHLGIKFKKISKNKLIAEMPVNEKSVQPFRILHGGASVALAETLCSIGAWINVSESETAVGVEINANHHCPVKEGGLVIATSTPVQRGKSIHVWETKIEDDRGKLVCTSKCTLAIIKKRK